MARTPSNAAPPGVSGVDPELASRFARARRARGEAYRPRTRHRAADGWAKYTNRLFLETSPYLLQHAHNPVDWYPWGDDAFEEARRLRRPVFVSIGYATCHWCHVMEEESFEDEEIARFLNEHFIAVKVDREEMPDVDAVYMKAVQGFTGTGGWPLNVWATPDREPFFGGTYFPPRDNPSGRGIGFLGLLRELSNSYVARPDEVVEVCGRVKAYIRRSLSPEGGDALPGADVLAAAARFYRDRFDRVHGGLAAAPKFPSHLPVRFLLRYHRRTREPAYLDMASRTLHAMAAGGIHDHVGGGFHRYSTDEKWLVPHFEKMLYDNALLAVTYLEAYQATGVGAFARVAKDTLRFVERDMTSPEGAFYSATDADSLDADGHREEGLFFTWTPAELSAALGTEVAQTVGRYFGVTPEGNFEGRTVLHAPPDPATVARELRLSEQELASVVSDASERLYHARAARPAPIRDEKILTAWNGLAISAYARAGLTLDDSESVERAGRAARFLLSAVFVDGRLHRTYKEGRTGPPGFLEDYTFLIAGLLDLYEASGDSGWLERAFDLDAVLAHRFEDRTGGGYFLTEDGRQPLLVREKPAYDGAEPSGNSVAVLNLLRLHEFTSDGRYRMRAEKTLRYLAPTLRNSPTTLSELLLAVDFLLDRPKQVLIVLPCTARTGDAAPLLSAFRTRFVPNRVFAMVREGEELDEAARAVPLLRGKEAAGGRATAFVCEDRACALPTADPSEFGRQLAVVKPLPG
jgi:uncharacterized protein